MKRFQIILIVDGTNLGPMDYETDLLTDAIREAARMSKFLQSATIPGTMVATRVTKA